MLRLLPVLLLACAPRGGAPIKLGGGDTDADSDDTIARDTGSGDTGSGDTGAGDTGGLPPTGALTADPTTLRFGSLPVGCTSVAREVVVTNDGDGDVEVSALRLAGRDAAAYAIPSPQGRTLAAATSLTVPVTFTPSEIKLFGQARLEVVGSTAAEVHARVDLLGEGAEDASYEDLFVQGQAASVDLLFALDQSGSMNTVHSEVARHLDVVVSRFTNLGIDYRIGFITTDSAATCATLTGPIVDPTTAKPAEAMSQQATTSRPCGGEEAFAATRAFLTSGEGQAFLRPDAMLAVYAVSDEEEQSAGFSPAQFASWLAGLKGGDVSRVSFHALAGPRTGTILAGCAVGSPQDADPSPRFHAAITQTGGEWGDICHLEIAPWLDRATVVASGLALRFPLTETPSGTPVVLVDGVEVDPDPANGWIHDAGANEIVFSGSAVPQPGGAVVVTYAFDTGCPTP